jgi:hypothetical protein
MYDQEMKVTRSISIRKFIHDLMNSKVGFRLLARITVLPGNNSQV